MRVRVGVRELAWVRPCAVVTLPRVVHSPHIAGHNLFTASKVHNTGWNCVPHLASSASPSHAGGEVCLAMVLVDTGVLVMRVVLVVEKRAIGERISAVVWDGKMRCVDAVPAVTEAVTEAVVAAVRVRSVS